MKEVKIGRIRVGAAHPVAVIAGPCVIESESSALRHAEKLSRIAKKAKTAIIYKSSFDKANRTSVRSYRGPGIDKGLKILKRVKDEIKIPVLSDVHSVEEVKKASRVLDILQVPAFLCRQTDLITAAAASGRAVNIKKGQFLAPWDVKHIIEKAESAGCGDIMITERGTSFGYNTLVSDFRSVILMKKFGYPVVYDATHSVQAPGGKGDKSGGDRKFVEPLAKAAVVCGADAIFLEAHEDPENALSDGPNMLPLDKLDGFLQEIIRLQELNGRG